MHNVKMSVEASHVYGLHGCIVSNHMRVGVVLVVGNAVEEVERLCFRDSATFAEDRVLVLDCAERLIWVILFDVVRYCE